MAPSLAFPAPSCPPPPLLTPRRQESKVIQIQSDPSAAMDDLPVIFAMDITKRV